MISLPFRNSCETAVFLLVIIETLQSIVAHDVDIFSPCLPSIRLVYRVVFVVLLACFNSIHVVRIVFVSPIFFLCLPLIRLVYRADFHRLVRLPLFVSLLVLLRYLVSSNEIAFVLAYRFISHILRISNKCSR